MEPDLFGANGPVFVGTMIVLIAFLVIISNVIHALIYCKIFAKAGYHWAYGLLILVPIAQIIVPFVLAFAEWPAQRELRELRQQTGTAPTGYR